MSTIALSAVPELYGTPPTVASGLRRYAVVAAAVLHLAVFLWLFHPWRSDTEKTPPAAMPVTLVFEPLPKPKPKPEPKPEPTPQAAPQSKPAPAPSNAFDRSSGPEGQTTAPPSEQDTVKNEEKPELAAPAPAPPAEIPAPPPPPAPAVVAEPPTPPKPKSEPPRPAARLPDEKPAPPHPHANTATAQHPRTALNRVAPGERRTTGDPYLNAIVGELDRHRYYPELARPLGLTGVARFLVVIDRRGRLIGMQLVQSSGSELLDRAAEKAIRDTLPFPPVPADYPGDPIEITMGIYVGPT